MISEQPFLADAVKQGQEMIGNVERNKNLSHYYEHTFEFLPSQITFNIHWQWNCFNNSKKSWQ